MQTVVTERGQVSIPSELRKRFHLVPGTGIEWMETKEGIFLLPVPKDPIASFRGKSKGLTKILRQQRKKERSRNR
jgi:AbrB family looped-hinge helix DNA binding protein